jgi:glutamate 5-kinase
VVTAQVLLTAFDVAARTQYLNARNTLKRLLEWKAVPIINENDTTSTDELCFGDNDALAAQVALLVKADLLVLLTDTDGLFTADPREDSGARPIATVDDPSELKCVRIGAVGPLGSGGMGSKVSSARVATSGGVETIIARGTRPDVLKACLAGEQVGTRFPARSLGLPDYKLWLLYGKPARGRVVVDAGAARALRGKGSLLPVGVIGVEGDFAAGDAVMVVDVDGTELAKGLVSYSREELDRVKGFQSGRVAELFPQASPEAIHRDYLVRVC